MPNHITHMRWIILMDDLLNNFATSSGNRSIFAFLISREGGKSTALLLALKVDWGRRKKKGYKKNE